MRELYRYIPSKTILELGQLEGAKAHILSRNIAWVLSLLSGKMTLENYWTSRDANFLLTK